ncbi:MAG: OmpH family outer membrane protein [Bacteroidaceae bacterium]|nr:OmpH family outer membrane protein [Bacteroidaceae bacterium]
MKKLIIAMLLALPMTMFAQKIGHVNTAAIAQAMPETTAAQTEIQNLQKQFQDELQRKQTELQTKAEAYEKEKAGLSETLRTYREQELQKAYDEYAQFGQTSEQELQRVYQTKMGEIQDKVMKAVQEVGAAGGFAYILDAQSLPFVGTTGTDVTDQVKAKLGVK